MIATPAPIAARLLQPHDDELGGLLGGIDYASVALVTLRVADDSVTTPLTGTGFLVPRRSAGRRDDQWAVTACTYLSQKWPHLARPGEHLLRASLGRFGDDRADAWTDAEVIERVWDELGALVGVSGAPMEARVTRWPLAFPQYRVHHSAPDHRYRGGRGPTRRRGRGRVGLSRRGHPGLHRQRKGRRARGHARTHDVSGAARRGRILLPSLASGLLLALSLPPWGWWPLGLAGAGLLYWRLAALPWRARLWSGWWAGIGCFALGLMWARAFNWYGALVLIVVEALFMAAAAGLTPHGAVAPPPTWPPSP